MSIPVYTTVHHPRLDARPLRCRCPTLEVDGVGDAGGAEVADVDALGPADAGPGAPAGCARARRTRTWAECGGSSRAAPSTRSPSGGPPCRRAARGRPAGCACRCTSTVPTASSLSANSGCGISFGVRYGEISPAPTNPNVTPPTTARPPSMHPVAGLEVAVPQARHVHVAVGEVGGLGQRAEHRGVLLPDRLLGERAQVRAAVGRQPGRDTGRELPGLVEPPRRCAARCTPGVLRPVQLCEDALRVVRVVEEQKHVAQADQHVRAVAGGGQRVGGAVHIADNVNPHEINIDSGGRRRRSRARVQHARSGGDPCLGEPGRRRRAPRGGAAPGRHAAPQGRRPAPGGTSPPSSSGTRCARSPGG